MKKNLLFEHLLFYLCYSIQSMPIMEMLSAQAILVHYEDFDAGWRKGHLWLHLGFTSLAMN